MLSLLGCDYLAARLRQQFSTGTLDRDFGGSIESKHRRPNPLVLISEVGAIHELPLPQKLADPKVLFVQPETINRQTSSLRGLISP
jgi:hypothetical protein